MTARTRRPQVTAGAGQRVVLVIPRAGVGREGTKALSHALDEVARLRWEVAAIIDPASHLDALRLVLDGEADVILATRPEHMPALRFAYDLDGVARSRLVSRPQPQDRPAADHPWQTPSRRPQPAQAAEPSRERRPRVLRDTDEGKTGPVPVVGRQRSQIIRRSA